jgi:hypothetical protein
MSDSLSSLNRRLVKLELEAAKRSRRKELANCICRDLMMTVAYDPEGFEAEMNCTCPVHGFRYLGQIIHIHVMNPDKTATERSLKLKALVDEYSLRLSQNSPSRFWVLNDDSE